MAHQMPAFPLIDPEPVTENVAKSLLGIFRLEAFQVWIEHRVRPPLVVGRAKSEGSFIKPTQIAQGRDIRCPLCGLQQ